MKEYFLEQAGIYYKANDFVETRPTILFVHGLSGSSSAWYRHEEKFREKYNIISYDLRGHGKSKRFKDYEDYAPEKFVEDIHTLISHLNINKFFIVSHSLGTIFALDFVLKYQDLVEGAIFLSPNFAIKEKWLGHVISPAIKVLEIFGMDNTKIQGKHIDYSKKYTNTTDWDFPRMLEEVSNTGLKTYLLCTKQVCEFDREAVLEKLNIPVLIMHGKKDTIFPVKNSIKLLKHIKNLELIILEKSDHILVIKNFEVVSAAIEKFVNRYNLIYDKDK